MAETDAPRPVIVRHALVQFYRCGMASSGHGWTKCKTPKLCTEKGCQRMWQSSSGHGHVVPRPDGGKARCGGPAICAKCAKEAAQSGRSDG